MGVEESRAATGRSGRTNQRLRNCARAQVAYIDVNGESAFHFVARRFVSSGTSHLDSVLLSVEMNAREEWREWR